MWSQAQELRDPEVTPKYDQSNSGNGCISKFVLFVCCACRHEALTVRAMGCRHRRVKKAVAAINRARSSGDREAVRRAVDRAKRLNPGQRDSERELRALTGSTRGGAGTSRTVRARSPTGEETQGEGACARKGGLYAGSTVDGEARDANTQDTSRPRARTTEMIATATATLRDGPVRVLMPDGGSCVAVKVDESFRAR